MSVVDHGDHNTVAGRYVVHEDIVGKGAWSIVKRCSVIPPYIPSSVLHSTHLTEEEKQSMRFVVKIIEKDYLISLTKGDVERAMAEVKREIEVLRHIPPHPHVVNFVEHFETEKQFMLIFEEVQCGDLCELILQAPNAKLDEGRAKKYTFQLLHAVLHCHVHDVIHRDIKPENLLVNSNDDLKLTDFGLAKWSRGGNSQQQAGSSSPQQTSPSASSSLCRDKPDMARLLSSFPGAEKLAGKKCVCSDVIGTPRYGAPEMFYAKFSQTQYDGFKADTWSVGVVVYIILSGTFPFFSGAGSSEKETFKAIIDTPLTTPAGISSQGSDFLHRLLNKDPAKRFTLAEALDHPWLESVAAGSIRRSEAITKLRLEDVRDPELIFKACGDEIEALHCCVAKLRRELMTFKIQGPSETPRLGTPGGARRTETPLPGSRPRTSTSPGLSNTASRLMSPGRLGSTSTSVKSPVVRTGSPSRVSGEAVARGSSTSLTTKSAATRVASPLARSSPSTIRRGTPLRPGATPSTPTSGGAALPTGAPAAASTAQKRSTTPPAGSARSLRPSGLPAAATASKEFSNEEIVIFKNCKGIVRFNGTTTFGAGIWIGLEMLEGNEGTNDGTSFVDKKRYFTCPKGKGVFVRTSQIKKADGDNP